MKDGKVGAFPSNFVKEVFVSPKGWFDHINLHVI